MEEEEVEEEEKNLFRYKSLYIICLNRDGRFDGRIMQPLLSFFFFSFPDSPPFFFIIIIRLIRTPTPPASKHQLSLSV
jgi:hypothetical protein